MSDKLPRRNSKAVQALLEVYDSVRRRIMTRYSVTPDCADDLTQDAFSRVPWAANEPVKDAQAYMSTVALSAFVDSLRKKGRSVTTVADSELTGGEAESHVNGTIRSLEALEAELDLHALVGQLPPDEAATLVLCKRDGWSYEEVAREMGVCTAKVRNRLARALAKCTILAAEMKFRGSAK